MQAYQCTTCGKISPEKDDLCTVHKEVSGVYTCENCNKQSNLARTICKPVKVQPTFYCSQCGSAAEEEDSLCNPVKL